MWTYIVLVALNALSNPVVYFMRMNGFHHYVNTNRVSSFLGSGIRSLSRLSVSSVRDANKMKRVVGEETRRVVEDPTLEEEGTDNQNLNGAAVQMNGAEVDTNNQKSLV